MDTVSKEIRSRMMAGIRGRDTLPEMKVRRLLHRHGMRYRLHSAKLPGRPDLVLARFRVCIFVQGCFWHRHPNCRYATTPRTREQFWQEKFAQNVAQDARNRLLLLEQGWRVIELWECGIRRAESELLWIPDTIRNCHEKHLSWPDTTKF